MIDLLPFLLVMLALLALSAFFSGSETALFSLTAGQVHQLAKSHARIGGLIVRLLKDPESLLITLLIGNMIVNVTYFTLAAVGLLLLKHDLGAHGWLIPIWAVGAFLTLVLFGEMSPKVIAFSYPRWSARTVVLPLYLVHRALHPAHRLLRSTLVRPLTRLAHPDDHVGRAVTIEELRDLLEVSERRGVLHADETMMLHEVLGLSQVKVRDVMVPRVHVVAFDIDRPIEQLHDLFRATGRSRLPVFRGDLDHVLGWADAKRVFLEPDRPLSKLLAPAHYAAELATAEQLLHDLRRLRAQRAIVVDEYGGTAGLVTIEDVLEEIVGDIGDSQSQPEAPPRRPLVQQVGPLEYSVSGQLPLHDWAELFGGEVTDPRLITVGGLVVKLLGRLPRPGDKVQYGNVAFTVESMGRRRIDRLRLELAPPAANGHKEGPEGQR